MVHERVEPGRYAPARRLFSSVVRKAVCCWHYKYRRSEWQRGTPDAVHKLLQTKIEELGMTDLRVVKYVNLNGVQIDSQIRKPYNLYFDRKQSPPVIYFNMLAEEEIVSRKFAARLAKAFNLTGNDKDAFCYFIEKAIRDQGSNKYKLELEKEFVAPPACNIGSTAYVAPLTTEELAELQRPMVPTPRASLSAQQAVITQQLDAQQAKIQLLASTILTTDLLEHPEMLKSFIEEANLLLKRKAQLDISLTPAQPPEISSGGVCITIASSFLLLMTIKGSQELVHPSPSSGLSSYKLTKLL